MPSITELDQISRTMADQVRPLCATPTRELYVRYLNTMFHYTRDAGSELRRAARVLPDTELQEHFTQLSREESEHYRLAAADLRALGEAPTIDVPEPVLRYREYWNAVPSARAFEYLGALFVLENVGKWVETDVLEGLATLALMPNQCTFIRVHLLADVEHGRLLSELCRRHWVGHEAEIHDGALHAAELWTNMHVAISERRAA